ncbi:unnamed protein product, partial [Brassica oleracea var. botrytis]
EEVQDKSDNRSSSGQILWRGAPGAPSCEIAPLSRYTVRIWCVPDKVASKHLLKITRHRFCCCCSKGDGCDGHFDGFPISGALVTARRHEFRFTFGPDPLHFSLDEFRDVTG